MKKFLSFTIVIAFLGSIGFLAYRYKKNPESQIPYPYIFQSNTYDKNISEAPILIIGDRLGKRLANYSQFMADIISSNLSKKVKIISLAEDGEGLHRTLEKIKTMGKLPLVTIYLGGSQEVYEQRFLTKDINKIIRNFKIYNDDRVKTLLMIFPVLSKFIYTNVNYQYFTNLIKEDKNEYTDSIIQKRNMIHFKLFEEELENMFSYIKEHGSYLIALTQPLNIDIPPKKSCEGSLDQLTKDKLVKVNKLVKIKDYKAAYNITKDLILIANANADVYYLHGEITKALGLLKEAKQALDYAVAYDCKQWRGNPVFNKILEDTAAKNEVLVLDFNKIIYQDWTQNTLFMDDLYPQNLYFEKAATALSTRIKKLLKL